MLGAQGASQIILKPEDDFVEGHQEIRRSHLFARKGLLGPYPLGPEPWKVLMKKRELFGLSWAHGKSTNESQPDEIAWTLNQTLVVTHPVGQGVVVGPCSLHSR